MSTSTVLDGSYGYAFGLSGSHTANVLSYSSKGNNRHVINTLNMHAAHEHKQYLYLSHCQLAQALECYLGKIEYIGLRTLLYFTCAMTCFSFDAAQGRVDCRELENHHYQGMQVWIEQVLAVLSAWRWTAQTTCYP